MPQHKKKPVVVDGERLWVCSRCNVPLPSSFFRYDARASSGLSSQCVRCQNEAKRLAGKARDRSRLWHAKNKHKAKAQAAVAQKLRSGKMHAGQEGE
jgi:hypothetical protein